MHLSMVLRMLKTTVELLQFDLVSVCPSAINTHRDKNTFAESTHLAANLVQAGTNLFYVGGSQNNPSLFHYIKIRQHYCILKLLFQHNPEWINPSCDPQTEPNTAWHVLPLKTRPGNPIGIIFRTLHNIGSIRLYQTLQPHTNTNSPLSVHSLFLKFLRWLLTRCPHYFGNITSHPRRVR